MSRLFGRLLCVCAALFAACAPTPEEKSDARVVVLVLVDGVQGVQVAQQWAAALGPIAWAGEVGAVSTSTAATLASVLTGEDPPVHGRFSARDYGVELKVPTIARVLREREYAPFERAVAACDRRELAPEVVGLNGGFDSWTTVSGGELGGALDSLQGEIDAARTRRGGTFVLAVETLPRVGSTRRFPSTLAEHLARELTPLVALRSDVPPLTDVDAWYERRWLADAQIGPALERAFAAAHVAALSQRLGVLVQELGSHHANWCVTVAGLVPPDALSPETIRTTVPIASVGQPERIADVGDLVEVAGALLRRVGSTTGSSYSPPNEPELWNADATLRGEDRPTDSGAPHGRGELRPALTFANGLQRPVRVVVTATEACMDMWEADDPNRKVGFTLASGESRSIVLDRPSPDLLIELSAEDGALREREVVIDREQMQRVPVMRVLDTRESELGAVDARARVQIQRADDGRLRISGRDLVEPIADTWPPPDEPLVVEADEERASTWFVRQPPATRLALLFAQTDEHSNRRPSTRETVAGGWGTYSDEDCAYEGRRLEPTALRFMWPPLDEVESLDLCVVQLPHVSITSTSVMGPAVRVPRELRPLLRSLLPHE